MNMPVKVGNAKRPNQKNGIEQWSSLVSWQTSHPDSKHIPIVAQSFVSLNFSKVQKDAKQPANSLYTIGDGGRPDWDQAQPYDYSSREMFDLYSNFSANLDTAGVSKKSRFKLINVISDNWGAVSSYMPNRTTDWINQPWEQPTAKGALAAAGTTTTSPTPAQILIDQNLRFQAKSKKTSTHSPLSFYLS